MIEFNSLKEVYENFELTPLKPGDSKLYTEYFGSFTSEMSARLIFRKNHQKKYLIVGHKGAGKSTYVNILAAEEKLNKNFFIVRYSIFDIGTPHDFQHYDLLLSLVLKSAETAEESGIKLKKKEILEVEDFAGLVTGEIKIERDEESKMIVKAGAEAGVDSSGMPFLKWLKLKTYAALQLSDESREKIRRQFRAKPHELLNKVNEFLTHLQNTVGKPILFMVDDMDKIPLDKTFKLFDETREFFEKPLATILYMIDISVMCSSRFAGISSIGDVRAFPSLKIFPFPGKDVTIDREQESGAIQNNRERIKNLIFHWCPEKLFDKGAVAKLIELGGGNTRQTLRLMDYALDYVVIESDKEKITEYDVEKAGIKLLNDYSLNMGHIEILKEIKSNPYWLPSKDKDISSPDSSYLDLVSILGIIEYSNGDKKWKYPNPVLAPLLSR